MAPRGLGARALVSDLQPSTSIDADLKKIAKVGRGKRDLVLIAGLVVVVLLIGAVWFAFRGSHVTRSAAAMTVPVLPSTPQAAPRPTTP